MTSSEALFAGGVKHVCFVCIELQIHRVVGFDVGASVHDQGQRLLANL